MVIELEDGQTFDVVKELMDGAKSMAVPFASASSPDEGAVISVWVRDKLVDRVHLSAPHSWWTLTSQAIFGKDTILAKDKAKISAEGGRITVRLDFALNR